MFWDPQVGVLTVASKIMPDDAVDFLHCLIVLQCVDVANPGWLWLVAAKASSL